MYIQNKALKDETTPTQTYTNLTEAEEVARATNANTPNMHYNRTQCSARAHRLRCKNTHLKHGRVNVEDSSRVLKSCSWLVQNESEEISASLK